MPTISVLKILRILDESLKAFLRARDDSRVVAEEQTTEHCHEHDGEQIGFATLILGIHNDYY
jgi:hypothetical protein